MPTHLKVFQGAWGGSSRPGGRPLPGSSMPASPGVSGQAGSRTKEYERDVGSLSGPWMSNQRFPLSRDTPSPKDASGLFHSLPLGLSEYIGPYSTPTLAWDGRGFQLPPSLLQGKVT